ncbi:hypothetical protein [Xanthomonas translucens]|uniref:hypothetical protein n=1 Tax=Xanthomonas campestris pv. translucens TaxID=343 RepID=UPI000A98C7ED|nr:hypothetical protein [Xanthomonas translucens pv. undulosa]QSQ40746.1 hypothetical protein ISN33_14040 [Xanthomonas translucens pv. translucens]UKE42186.1 hypothetical protein KAF26_11760 [Xanthomonas translucens pv. secalis]QEN93312.1 hypothetical protein F0H33_07925 [Xanthomonas translucens pv. undulosa]QEO26166.1 hypothetical protein F0H32_08160 [Xanthomonas translucens pv. undulosa]
MTIIDQINTAGDLERDKEKDRARMFSGLGMAGPAASHVGRGIREPAAAALPTVRLHNPAKWVTIWSLLNAELRVARGNAGRACDMSTTIAPA